MGLIKYTDEADRSMPVYVTRETAAGETMQYSMPIRQTMRVMLLAYVNVMLWGVIGLVAGVALLITSVIIGVMQIVEAVGHLV